MDRTLFGVDQVSGPHGARERPQGRPRLFIDGEAGTTGLEIRERLANLSEIDVLSIDPERRKDPQARLALMARADLVVLCLPDDAAREAVVLVESLGANAPRVLDASTAHRTAPDWVYGFAELALGQSEAIHTARRVSNPGCYATGAIALLRPLIDAGLIPPDTPVSINAVSGYSGGGRTMIESYEKGHAPAFELYGLALDHKHIPELMVHGRLARRPMFVPSVGNFRQGMLVSIPVHLDALSGKPTRAADLEAALAAYYKDAEWVAVIPAAKETRLAAEALNGSDRLELQVFGNETHRQVVLVARLDNLGKGAAGAAVQNIRLMLGVHLTATRPKLV